MNEINPILDEAIDQPEPLTPRYATSLFTQVTTYVWPDLRKRAYFYTSNFSTLKDSQSLLWTTDRSETLQVYTATISLSSLQILDLYVIPTRFYESKIGCVNYARFFSKSGYICNGCIDMSNLCKGKYRIK